MAHLGELGRELDIEADDAADVDTFTFHAESFFIPHRISSRPLVRFAWRGKQIDAASAKAKRDLDRARTDEDRAAAMSAQGAADVDSLAAIYEVLSTIARTLKAHPAPDQTSVPTPSDLQLDLELDVEPDVEPEAVPDVVPEAEVRGYGAGRIGQGVFFSRYAGAMLLHAFSDRVGAAAVLSGAVRDGGDGRAGFDDVGLLVATSMVFGLGAESIEQVKHLTTAEAGPLCGLARLPDRSTLRPRLASIAEGCDPLALQRAFASAMLGADPCMSGVYFVDDHFVPYTGAKPAPKGWDTTHRVAQKGRADTWVVDAGGRAVVFTTGEPSGLTKTLPGALAELRTVIGPDAKIMLGFDRGGAYASVFTACRDAHADWITYRRAPLPAPKGLPLLHTTIAADRDDTPRVWVYADEPDEPVELDGYGTARQITLFEHGQMVLQVLTSDTTTCPIALLRTLRARWRIENAFKYVAQHHGIDTLADYIADIETNTRPVDNPDPGGLFATHRVGCSFRSVLMVMIFPAAALLPLSCWPQNG